MALSRSQNENTGEELMAKHLGKVMLGGEASAFKPIRRPRSETDEEKLEADAHHLVVKPRPVIFVNDSELRLSPISPPYIRDPLGGGDEILPYLSL